MKKISLIILLVVLLMLAVPVTAQLPVCSDTVLTVSDRCDTDGPNSVQLDWTAESGADSYAMCTEQFLGPFCFAPDNILQRSGSLNPGDYTIWIEAYDENIIAICDSNKVTVTTPFNCGTPAPEFPSMFLPVTMIIGLLGAVLFIKRTREH